MPLKPNIDGYAAHWGTPGSMISKTARTLPLAQKTLIGKLQEAAKFAKLDSMALWEACGKIDAAAPSIVNPANGQVKLEAIGMVFAWKIQKLR